MKKHFNCFSASLTLMQAAVVLGVCLVGRSYLVAEDPRTADQSTAAGLRVEARIAAEQGDLKTALNNIEQAARASGDRVTAARAGKVAKAMQSGGGSPFANFDELIQLIMSQTDPPARWIDGSAGEGGAISISSNGVFVGAPAALATVALMYDDSGLLGAAERARLANQNDDIHKSTDLRFVSLPRLESHVKQLIKDGHDIPGDVMSLAGITRVRYLFVFPESREVVIGGPAGAWAYDAVGRTVNRNSGRPTLNLDDLVTLTRAFDRDGQGFFMCSIDPKTGQVQQVNDYVKSNQKNLTTRNAAKWAADLEQALGLQDVVIQGIPQDSHVASVIVEADYQMKQIGIGQKAGAAGMKSFFDLLTRSEQRGSSMEALRWWLAIGYDAIKMSPRQTAFELTGRTVRCLSENQFVAENGERKSTGKASRPNAEFARLFTEHLPALAEQNPVFAELQNVFDMSVVAALLHSHGLADKAGWMPSTFSPAGEFESREVSVPSELMTAANHRIYNGRNIVIQVAGGVRVDVSQLLNRNETFVETPELANDEHLASPVGHPNRWWWDAVNE